MKQIGNVSFFKTIAIALEYYRPFRKALIISVTLAAIMEGVAMLFPYLYGRMTDDIFSVGRSEGFYTVFIWATIFAVMLAIDSIVNYVRERFEIKNLDLIVQSHIDIVSVRKLLRWTLGQLNFENSGKVGRILSKGQSSLDQFTRELLYNIIPLTLTSTYAIIGLFILDYRLGSVVFICAAIYIWIVLYKNKEITKVLLNIEKLDNEEGVVQSEIMRNLDLVKIHNKEEFGIDEIQSFYTKSNARNINFWIKFLNFFWSSRTIVTVTEVITLLLGGYLAFELNVITPGLLITVFLWSRSVVNQVSKVGNVQRRIMRAMSQIHEFDELMKTKPLFDGNTGTVVSELKGEISLNNVSFTYPKRKKKNEMEASMKEESSSKALENISVTFEAGKRYAIVGHSGSGKSTLRQLLLRAYDPQEGSISYDGTNLKEFNLSSLHQHIAIVEQEVSVFDRSLKENITWVLPDPNTVTKEQLDRIIEMSAIDQFLPKLDHGLDTILGEKGVKLSGGERQRVGIARALMKDPKVLILDEATSHLDAVNEDDITQALEKASVGRTTIVIAHRLSTIVSADEIIVMDQGKVVGTGTHAHLFKTCPAYKDLVDAQLKAIHKLKI